MRKGLSERQDKNLKSDVMEDIKKRSVSGTRAGLHSQVLPRKQIKWGLKSTQWMYDIKVICDFDESNIME